MQTRQIGPRADPERQRVVGGRALDQQPEGGVGKARALVPGDRVSDLAVAARHQHVGHRLAQALALGNGRQMLLALALGGGDEVGVVEPLRVEQHRAGHLDVVIEGERTHHTHRRVRHFGKPARKLGAGLGLDRGGELGEDLVEQPDLDRRVALRAVDEEIGDAREHVVALRLAAGRQRVLELVEQRRRGGRGGRRGGHRRAPVLCWNLSPWLTVMKKRLRPGHRGQMKRAAFGAAQL